MSSIVQANTAGIGSNKDNANFPSGETTYKKTYTRMLQHYVTNNNASTAPEFNGTAGQETWRQGWFHLPYTNIHMAMTARDIETMLVSGRKWRVLHQGFKIKRIQCIQQQVNTNGATAQISSSFVQAPTILIYKDDKHELFQFTAPTTQLDTAPFVPIWSSTNFASNIQPPLPNQRGRRIFSTYTSAADGTSGTLYEVKFGIPNSSGYTTGTEGAYQFDLMNGGNVTTLSTGDTYTASHGISTQWISCAEPAVNFASPTPRFNAIHTVAYEDTTNLVPNIASAEQNAGGQLTGTVVNEYSPAPMHLIRVPPVANTLGNIILNYELWVEYTMTIEVMCGRFLWQRNPGATTISDPSITLNYFPQSTRNLMLSSTPNIVPQVAGQEGPAEKRSRLEELADEMHDSL